MFAAAHRPIAVAGAAALGAGIIAATPALAPMAPAIPHLDAPQIALQASILDIFKFPALRQIAANQVEVLAIEANGLAEAGQGGLQSVIQLPAALITATRQTLTGNPLDALTTLEDWTVNSAKATFVPLITARITVGQIDLAIQSALLPAWPLALVSLTGGLFQGADAIARGLITAGQNLFDAVLSFNLGKIVQAVVSGINGIVGSVVTGAQTAVDGVVGAQTLLADALAARPGSAAIAAAVPAAPKTLRTAPAAAERISLKPAAAVQEQESQATPVTEASAPKPARAQVGRGAASRRAVAQAAAADENASADNAGSGSHRRAKVRHAADAD